MKTDARAAFLFIACACLEGAVGVGLAALAAHKYPDSALSTAAQLLIMHAAGAVGLIAVGLWSEKPALFLFAAGAMMLGAALFGADMSARIFLGDRLFAYAAPNGGILIIAGWLIAALAAFKTFFQSSPSE